MDQSYATAQSKTNAACSWETKLISKSSDKYFLTNSEHFILALIRQPKRLPSFISYLARDVLDIADPNSMYVSWPSSPQVSL